MNGTKVDINGFADSIMKELNNYKDATVEAMSSAVNETASMAVQELRSANPAGSGKYGSWDDYNKGWKGTKNGKGRNRSGVVIHNATHYRLTHLLEYGHALRDGGKAQAFPHIAPVDEKCEKMLMEALESRLESI